MARSRLTISVITPTIGRDSLRHTVDSIAPQLHKGDEHLVLADGPDAYAKAVAVHSGTVEGRPSGDWGNKLRDQAMAVARGRMLMFCDDDDVFTADALAVVRRRCDRARTRIHIFRMTGGPDGQLWNHESLGTCNVGTPMFVLPNIPGRLGRWQNPDGPFSDSRFINDTAALHPLPPIFHPEVIALVGGTP
jgi:glycosyltransferase involved in cell wall biosynthesis